MYACFHYPLGYRDNLTVLRNELLLRSVEWQFLLYGLHLPELTHFSDASPEVCGTREDGGVSEPGMMLERW